MRVLDRMRGNLRLARGRCPSCNSERAHPRTCRTCLGFEGPFPPTEATQARWAGRFARTIAVRPAARATRSAVAGFPATR
jgi:hypothetical protein